jgi:hypothetical protein
MNYKLHKDNGGNMLTFEEKLKIIESFSQLKRNDVSLGRVNFQYEESSSDKKNVVYHLHPNGNGFVYTGKMSGYEKNDKGMTNIRDFSAEELHEILEKSITSLAPKSAGESAIIGEQYEEKWMNETKQTLILVEEDEMWHVYAGLNLDGIFTSYEEAVQYLEDEGFKKL